MPYGVRSPLRRDAQRNRTAIVEAACDLMMSERPGVGLPEIARRAGVGQATVYRHFPDRRALAAAVLTYQLDRLGELVAATADQPHAFRILLREVLTNVVVMRPLVRLVQELDPQVRARCQRRMTTTLAPSLRLAQEHGQVRSDLVPDDLVLLFQMVNGIAEATGETGAAVRAIDLALHGL